MHLRPMTRKDLPSATSVSYAAFMDNELNNYLWSHRKDYPQDYYDNLLWRSKKQFVSPGFRGIVVVADAEDASSSGLDEGQVMGWAWYSRLPTGKYFDSEHTPKSAFATQEEADVNAKRDLTYNQNFFTRVERGLLAIEGRYGTLVGANRAVNQVNESTFLNNLMHDKSIERLPSHWHLAFLACDPRFEGRGIGTRLIHYAKRLAEEDGVPLSLVSSPGRPQGIYTKKEGMLIVDWVTIPGMDFEGGAVCLWDPWKLWAKPRESTITNPQGKPITGEWVVEEAKKS